MTEVFLPMRNYQKLTKLVPHLTNIHELKKELNKGNFFYFYKYEGEGLGSLEFNGKDEIHITMGIIFKSAIELKNMFSDSIKTLNPEHTYLLDIDRQQILFDFTSKSIVGKGYEDFQTRPRNQKRTRLLVLNSDAGNAFTIWGNGPLVSILQLNSDFSLIYNAKMSLEEEETEVEVREDTYFILTGLMTKRFSRELPSQNNIRELKDVFCKGRPRGLLWREHLWLENPSFIEQCLTNFESMSLSSIPHEGIEEDKQIQLPILLGEVSEENEEDTELTVTDYTNKTVITFLELVERGLGDGSNSKPIGEEVDFFSVDVIKGREYIHSMTFARGFLYVYVKEMNEALINSLHEILEVDKSESLIKFILVN